MGREIGVSKQTVDVIHMSIGTDHYTLEMDEALDLLVQIATHLGRELIFLSPCTQRYAHGAHVDLNGDGKILYCNGLAYDQT